MQRERRDPSSKGMQRRMIKLMESAVVALWKSGTTKGSKPKLATFFFFFFSSAPRLIPFLFVSRPLTSLHITPSPTTPCLPLPCVSSTLAALAEPPQGRPQHHVLMPPSNPTPPTPPPPSLLNSSPLPTLRAIAKPSHWSKRLVRSWSRANRALLHPSP